jgi:hypothetical protein
MVLHFPPNGSTCSQVIHPSIHLLELKRGQTLSLVNGTSPLDFYHSISSKLLTINHHGIGLTRMNRNINLNAATVPYKSYKLNVQSNYIINIDLKPKV